MPKKNLPRDAVPTFVQDRLSAWGQVIRTQRALQKIRATDLCARLEISEATLRRLERGDAGAGAGLYLMAFEVLGVLAELAPAPPQPLWNQEVKQRVRIPPQEADDYF